MVPGGQILGDGISCATEAVFPSCKSLWRVLTSLRIPGEMGNEHAVMASEKAAG